MGISTTVQSESLFDRLSSGCVQEFDMDPGQARAVALALRPGAMAALGNSPHQINASVHRTRSNLCRLARIDSVMRGTPSSWRTGRPLGLAGTVGHLPPRSPPAIPSGLAICQAPLFRGASTCADLALALRARLDAGLVGGSSVMQSNSPPWYGWHLCSRFSPLVTSSCHHPLSSTPQRCGAGAEGEEMSGTKQKPLQRERAAWIKPVIVTVFVAFILSASVAAHMGWLPLTPRNDLVRSLQR